MSVKEKKIAALVARLKVILIQAQDDADVNLKSDLEVWVSAWCAVGALEYHLGN